MPTGAPTQFQLPCPKCGVQLLATTDQVGRLCACPSCKAEFAIPPAAGAMNAQFPAGGKAERPVSGGPQATYCFRCLRCGSTLQAQPEQAGQPGKCPTCDASFTIPEFNPRTGAATGDADPGDDGENPTPLHAYAAAGRHAPRLVRQPDDSLVIECPTCHAMSPVESNNCTGCGLPFTLDGATPPPPVQGPFWVLVSLLLAGGVGIVAIIAVGALLLLAFAILS